MRKILLIVLVIIGFLLIGFALFSKNMVNTNNRVRTLENKLIEYCEKIFIDLESDENDVYQITIDEIEEIFEFDLSEFRSNNCSLTESYVTARFENKKMVCTPKLACEF